MSPSYSDFKIWKKTTDINKTPKRNHCHTLHEENLGHTTFGASSNLESVQLAWIFEKENRIQPNLGNPIPTTGHLHLWSLLLAHLPGPLWKSPIAPSGMLHLVYGMNSPLISASLVRHSLLLFLLSHMAVHHLHLLHYHRLHHLLLAQYFILYSRLGSSANHFLHRPFPFPPDWLHGLSDHAHRLYG